VPNNSEVSIVLYCSVVYTLLLLLLYLKDVTPVFTFVV
jgi:hypothetical protein